MFNSNYFPNDLFDNREVKKTKNVKEVLTQIKNKPEPLASFTPFNNPKTYQEEDMMEQISIWKNNGRSLNRNLKQGGQRIHFEESSFKKETYTSFSGTDTKMTISFKGGKPVPVGEAQTLTYSLYRPINPVYNLGSAKPAGYVRGQRTIAGSIIFTVFDRNVLLNAFYAAYNGKNGKCLEGNYLTDELPPFDIQLTFLNEYGQSAFLTIHDVFITSEGQVMSIEDMITENTMQYLASDITLMHPSIHAFQGKKMSDGNAYKR